MVLRAQQETLDAQNGNVVNAVARSTKIMVIYYDFGAKTIWLVLGFSFVVHLAFARLFRGGTKATVSECICFTTPCLLNAGEPIITEACIQSLTTCIKLPLVSSYHGKQLKREC